MWIYKIVNCVNNKVYIGQTIVSIQRRFSRHINDSINNIIDTHLARAIRKYGKDSFSIEIVEEVSSQSELTKREQYWIKFFDSINSGYNETDATSKCGGNTYLSKTTQELDSIRKKLSLSKLGGKNPHSRSVKLTNTETLEVMIFSSQRECANYLGLVDHSPISRRCRGEIKKPLLDKYKVQYYNNKQ